MQSNSRTLVSVVGTVVMVVFTVFLAGWTPPENITPAGTQQAEISFARH